MEATQGVVPYDQAVRLTNGRLVPGQRLLKDGRVFLTNANGPKRSKTKVERPKLRSESAFDRSEQYRKYMASESWRAKRRTYFAKFGSNCKGCGKRDHIHVHHKTYERFGQEDLSDLVSVCQSCHTAIHELHKLGGGMSLWVATEKTLARLWDSRGDAPWRSGSGAAVGRSNYNEDVFALAKELQRNPTSEQIRRLNGLA